MDMEDVMPDKLDIQSLRAAIQNTDTADTTADDERFLQMAKRYEMAVQHLVAQVHRIVDQIPDRSGSSARWGYR
jgi:hypothetical protein